MTLVDPVTEYPLPLAILRSYLLSRTEITAVTSQRISDTMPAATASPRWPAIRLDETITRPAVRHRAMRTLFQADCWAATQKEADRLALDVVSVLEAVRQYETSTGWLYHATDLAVRSELDRTLNPHQPRSIVTGHLFTRPT